MKYVDAHCHIQFDQYADDDVALIERMYEEGVAGVVVGVDLESSKKAIALAEQYEHLYAAVGLHPNYIEKEVFDSAVYTALAQHPKVVAIGECGLDNFRPVVVTDDVKHRQKEVLRAQIALAGALKKPLIIHSRPAKGTMDAYHDLTDILKDAKNTYPALCGDIHFFVGGIPEMQALTSLDFTVSFTAVITFARDYDDVIRATPLTSILSETDAPYVAPLRRRGTKNDPLTTIEVVAKIAEIRNEPLELVQATLCATATRLFALK